VTGKRVPHLFADRRVYRIALLLCGAVVLTWLAWEARNDLQRVLASTHPSVFVAAVALGVLFMAAQGMLFSRLMTKHGSQNETGNLVAAFLLSQPGKYIPGKIWSPVMQSFALKQETSFAGIAIANMELAAIAIIQTTALGVACLRPGSPLVITCALAAALSLSIAVMMLPTAMLIARASPRLTTMLRIRPPGNGYRNTPLREAIALAGVTLGANFLASWCVLSAAGSVIPSGAHAPILSSLYLGFATSMLAIPVPAGIGIREAATAGVGAYIAPGIPNSLIISIALLARCWQLAVDGTCLGVGAMLQVYLKRR